MLTDQERQIVEYGKAQGKTKEQSIEALAKFRATNKPPLEPPKEMGAIADISSDIVETARGIKDVVVRRGEKEAEIIKARTEGQGAPSTIFQSATNLANTIPEIAGQIIVGVGKLFTSEKTEKDIASAVSDTVGRIVEQPIVKQFIQNYKDIEREDPEKARNIVATAEGGAFLLEFLGLGKAKQLVETGVKKGIDVGIEVAKETARTTKSVTSGVASAVAKPIQGISRATAGIRGEVARIPSRVATNIATKEAVEATIKSLPTKTSQVAVRDGIDISDVRDVLRVAAKPQNKPILRQIAGTAKAFSEGVERVNPIEIVGKPIVAKLKQVNSVATSIGKKLSSVADDLGAVTQKEAKEAVLNRLRGIPGLKDLKTTMLGQLDFSNTVLATSLTKADRQAIRKVFVEAVRAGSGKQKHLLRQELFEILGGKKRSLQAITDTQEKAYEAIRKGLSDVLDTKNAQYKNLNSQYSKIIRPLQDLRKLMRGVAGADEDILEMSAGLLARRLTSNAASNPQLRATLRSLDNIISAIGKGSGANIEDLQDFYNILNRYYKIAGETGFQGQVRAGVESASGVSEFIIKTARNLAGESTAVRQKALEDLLVEALR